MQMRSSWPPVAALAASSLLGLATLLLAGPCTTGDAPRTAAAFAQDGIELPPNGSITALPLHVLAHVGRPGERVQAVLRWPNGIALTRSFSLLRGPDGQGLLIANLDWDEGTRPALPAMEVATLELVNEAGTLLGQREVSVMGPDNSQARAVMLYFVDGDTVAPVERRIPLTLRIATATVDELLWGPGPGDPPNLITALPTPEDVLSYGGRNANWGARVELRGIKIVDSVATVDFSRELGAYGGGSFRVGMIDQQITRTLEQFPGLRQVRIAIEGETGGVLEP